MTDRRPLVYLAGPYSIGDSIENIRAALTLGTLLLDAGFVSPVVPHLTGFWDLLTPRPYETWLALDLDVLARCDAVLRFGGISAGADREVERARELGLPVFEMPSLGDLYAWAAEWNE